MRQLIATVFNVCLDGLLADEGTASWKSRFSLPENRQPDDPAHLDVLRSAYAHVMGRTAYEGISTAMITATDHPFAVILNSGRKVVFSRTLTTADWPNTVIASGDTTAEIETLRQGGHGHVVVWGESAYGGRSGGSTWSRAPRRVAASSICATADITDRGRRSPAGDARSRGATPGALRGYGRRGVEPDANGPGS
jgi:dihydrofolate reductase